MRRRSGRASAAPSHGVNSPRQTACRTLFMASRTPATVVGSSFQGGITGTRGRGRIARRQSSRAGRSPAKARAIRVATGNFPDSTSAARRVVLFSAPFGRPEFPGAKGRPRRFLRGGRTKIRESRGRDCEKAGAEELAVHAFNNGRHPEMYQYTSA